MRQAMFVLCLFAVIFLSYAMAEEPVPSVSPTPEATVSGEPTPEPTPTPKPPLQPGEKADGLALKLNGPFHFKVVEGEIIDPVNIDFRFDVTGENKELKLNTNPYAVFKVEAIDEDKHEALKVKDPLPTDGTEFTLTLTEGSYFGARLKALDKYFDFSAGGRFWVRASYTLGEKTATSDWAPVDIYSRTVVRIETREGGFVVLMRDDKAPMTCANFVKLASNGFYEHLIFHRIESRPGFKLIQGGCPHGDGSGDAGYKIDFETNDLKHEAGSIAMGLSPGDKNSAGSQFYICVEAVPSLDNQYCVFGKVIEGMETIKRIGAVAIGDSPTRPRVPVEMSKVTVEYWK